MGEVRSVFKILTVLERNFLVGHSHRYEENIRMELKVIVFIMRN